MDIINHLNIQEVPSSDDDSVSSEENRWSGDDSVLAKLGIQSVVEVEDGGSVQGGLAGQSSLQSNCRVAAISSLEMEKTARDNNDIASIQNVAGSEENPVANSLWANGPIGGGLVTLDEVNCCETNGPAGISSGSRECGPFSMPSLGIETAQSPQAEIVIPKRRSYSQQAESRHRGKKQKPIRYPYSTKVWNAFINSKCKKKMKSIQGGVESLHISDCHSNGMVGWELGKKLGLSSTKSDAEMETILRREEIIEGGQGARDFGDK